MTWFVLLFPKIVTRSRTIGSYACPRHPIELPPLQLDKTRSWQNCSVGFIGQALSPCEELGPWQRWEGGQRVRGLGCRLGEVLVVAPCCRISFSCSAKTPCPQTTLSTYLLGRTLPAVRLCLPLSSCWNSLERIFPPGVVGWSPRHRCLPRLGQAWATSQRVVLAHRIFRPPSMLSRCPGQSLCRGQRTDFHAGKCPPRTPLL